MISTKKSFLIAGITIIALLILFGSCMNALSSPPSGPSAHVGGSTVGATAATPQATTERATTPPPAPPAPPKTFEGRGDDVVDVGTISDVAVIDFECPKCSSNVIVKHDGRDDSLLVNTIGSHKGRYLIGLSSGGGITTTFTIQADGAWKLTIAEGLDTLRKETGAFQGKGDDVVLLMADTNKARITHKGESNFIVKVWSDTDLDLAINEIGSYEGTVPLEAPAAVMIKSEGDWTVTPA